LFENGAGVSDGHPFVSIPHDDVVQDATLDAIQAEAICAQVPPLLVVLKILVPETTNAVVSEVAAMAVRDAGPGFVTMENDAQSLVF